MATPYASLRLPEARSTQDAARERFGGRPLLVVADHQTHGRGRLGRHWDPAPRALAASLAFLPQWPRDTWPRLTLVAGLAARTALPEPLELHWPNDLYRGERKAGGILVEATDEVVVAGLGVNLWWPQSPPDRVGVFDADPGPDAAMDLAATWAESLLARASGPPDEWGREEAEAACATVGRRVELGDGRIVDAVGIDTDGGLVVRDSTATWTVVSGPLAKIGDRIDPL